MRLKIPKICMYTHTLYYYHFTVHKFEVEIDSSPVNLPPSLERGSYSTDMTTHNTTDVCFTTHCMCVVLIDRKTIKGRSILSRNHTQKLKIRQLFI